MESRFLHADRKINASYLQELGGRDIFKYYVRRDRPIYLNYSAELYTKPPMKYFTGPRIIIREIPGETLICAYATEKFLVNKSCYVLRNEDAGLTYPALLGLLNSRLIGFWIANSGEKSQQNLFPRISMATIKGIPIPKSGVKFDRLEELVEAVLESKAKDREADTSPLEAKIDRIVYKLYGLTEEEIAVVEGAGEKKPTVTKSERPRRAPAPAAAVVAEEDDEELE